MSRLPHIHDPWTRLRGHLPSGAEWHDYALLCKEVLLVIVSFVLLALLLAFAADLVPSMLR